MALTAAAVRRELKSQADPVKAAFFPRFFKSGPGEYAEGDKFLGVTVPKQRLVAKEFRDLSLVQISKLLDDPYHECRLTGLLILVHHFEKAAKAKDEPLQKQLLDFYLSRTDAINNWDLVDSTAHKILGRWLSDKPDRRLLDRLSKSKNMWEQRISVLATLPLIKQGEFDEVLRLCERLIDHPHDLIHKVTGWMLREAGKVEPKVLEAFLNTFATDMPRTMLRYAIEKLSEPKRKKYLTMKS